MPRSSSRKRFAPAALAWLGLALLSAIGCGKAEPERVAVHPVKGQVILAGKPAAGAVVVFHPKAPGAFPPPRAQADKDGNYSVTTFKTADGAPLGEYVITVELRALVEKGGEYIAGPNQVPAQYSEVRTSKLVASVVEGENQVPIKIVR